uniref:Uncharacterized protein n=1 Tax=Nonomuraea gerenzanensis TaxID=93944 RepID=A0A1M4E5A7_9ACTN|nr:hypothetical protein BN4615_P3545 [Nonomuraea gerenzanensis]
MGHRLRRGRRCRLCTHAQPPFLVRQRDQPGHLTCTWGNFAH